MRKTTLSLALFAMFPMAWFLVYVLYYSGFLSIMSENAASNAAFFASAISVVSASVAFRISFGKE